jgi:hypothetical protein
MDLVAGSATSITADTLAAKVILDDDDDDDDESTASPVRLHSMSRRATTGLPLARNRDFSAQLSRLIYDVDMLANGHPLSMAVSDQLHLAQCMHAAAWHEPDLLDGGSLPKLLALVGATSPSVRAEALCALWNLAADAKGAARFVDVVGAVPTLCVALVDAEAAASSAFEQAQRDAASRASLKALIAARLHLEAATAAARNLAVQRHYAILLAAEPGLVCHHRRHPTPVHGAHGTSVLAAAPPRVHAAAPPASSAHAPLRVASPRACVSCVVRSCVHSCAS